uniref:Uncharacterized protein n=1 Tax=Prolemur simus TaxID=1328070 RepID=A0A8C8YLT2_PROSS
IVLQVQPLCPPPPPRAADPSAPRRVPGREGRAGPPPADQEPCSLQDTLDCFLRSDVTVKPLSFKGGWRLLIPSLLAFRDFIFPGCSLVGSQLPAGN